MKHYRELERAIQNPKQNKTESKLLEDFACSNPISPSGFLPLYLHPNRCSAFTFWGPFFPGMDPTLVSQNYKGCANMQIAELS